MTNSNHNKDQIERQVLELFRQNYILFPKGKVIKSESPDFIIQLSPRKNLGIELVELHLPLNLVEATLAAISSKEEKLSYYLKKRLNEYWLLIWLENLFEKQSFNIHNALSNLSFDSGYHKVFLLDKESGKVFALK